MTRPHHQPYEREFEESLDLLHRMSREEHDALLRDAGILGDDGDLAARYRPVEAQADESEASTSVASS